MTVVAEGTKTNIRSLRLEDAPLFARWWNDGRLMAAVGFRKGLGVTEEKLYEDFKKEIDDENPYREQRRYVVLDRETPIGELSYGELDTEVGKCRVGIKICEISAQGRGFGKDALLAFMRYLFVRFGLQKIEIYTLKDNVRAEALYRKVGFYEVKTEQNFWQDPDGIWHDLVFMEISRSEFSQPTARRFWRRRASFYATL